MLKDSRSGVHQIWVLVLHLPFPSSVVVQLLVPPSALSLGLASLPLRAMVLSRSEAKAGQTLKGRQSQAAPITVFPASPLAAVGIGEGRS